MIKESFGSSPLAESTVFWWSVCSTGLTKELSELTVGLEVSPLLGVETLKIVEAVNTAPNSVDKRIVLFSDTFTPFKIKLKLS
jgi:hypothetical protein